MSVPRCAYGVHRGSTQLSPNKVYGENRGDDANHRKELFERIQELRIVRVKKTGSQVKQNAFKNRISGTTQTIGRDRQQDNPSEETTGPPPALRNVRDFKCHKKCNKTTKTGLGTAHVG